MEDNIKIQEKLEEELIQKEIEAQNKKDEEFKKTLGKMELSPEQLEEFLSTGSFTVKKEYMNGKISVGFRFLTNKKITEIRDDIKKRFIKNVEGETKEEHNKKKEEAFFYNLSKEIYSFYDGDNNLLDFDNFYNSVFFQDEVDPYYSIMKGVYTALLRDGVYNPVGEFIASESIKKPSDNQENS